ncbi:MAG: sodium:solute symporter [Leadbetterella sp.]
MSQIDWGIFIVTILSIVLYGIYKNRKDKNLDEYLLGGKSLPWYHICLSTMATQASAITFLSAPGQGFEKGLHFVQFYFGLPLAIVFICIVFIPRFSKLNIFTAYEYLENRFDTRIRIVTSTLFLFSRGIATGISIYAPSLVLSTLFGLDIMYTNCIMGGLVLIYTVIGGTKAISYTHVQQMFFVLLILFFAAYLLIQSIPSEIGLIDSMKIAAVSGKMKILNFDFNLKEKYNIWSGLLGGFFLQLSYFGTDQSQVGRYLVAKNIDESKMGLLVNAILKIPMQFLILSIGILVYIHFFFHQSPLIFNHTQEELLESNPKVSSQFQQYKNQFQQLQEKRKSVVFDISQAIKSNNSQRTEIHRKQFLELENKIAEAKLQTKDLLKTTGSYSDDINYIFLHYIMHFLPVGLIGFLIAVIFTASMGSIASAYNSMAACSQLDILNKIGLEKYTNNIKTTKLLTMFWALFCIAVANWANNMGSSLLELVNELGSLFYGIILGIFIVAFFARKVNSRALFPSIIISQLLIFGLWQLKVVTYLWLNPIGVVLVFGFSIIFQLFMPKDYVK